MGVPDYIQFKTDLLSVLNSNPDGVKEFISAFIAGNNAVELQIQNLLHEWKREEIINYTEGYYNGLLDSDMINTLSIRIKGQEFLKPNMASTTTINVGRDMIGNAINQSSLDFNPLNQSDTEIPTVIPNKYPPHVKPHGWFKKFISWCKKHSHEILMTIILSIVASIIFEYFIKDWIAHLIKK